jgi:hypothetical protein
MRVAKTRRARVARHQLALGFASDRGLIEFNFILAALRKPI